MEKLQASQKEVEKEKVSYEREKKSKRSFKHFDMPEDAEREVIIHDLSDEEKVDPITGEMLECIGEDVREQLQYIQAIIRFLKSIPKSTFCQGILKLDYYCRSTGRTY